MPVTRIPCLIEELISLKQACADDDGLIVNFQDDSLGETQDYAWGLSFPKSSPHLQSMHVCQRAM